MRIRHNKKLIQLILAKAEELCKTIKTKPPKTKRGRPRKYPDHLIIFALLLKVLENLSLRDLEERLKDFFPKHPDHVTLWYRIRQIESSDLMELIQKTAEKIMKKLEAKEFYCLISDATGFGDANTYKLPWLRGKEIREVQSHVKTEVLVGVVKGKTVVVGVNVGKAYSDECKLLSPMLRELEFKAKYFLADAYYGKVETLEMVKALKMCAIVPIKNTLHKKVRHPIRLWAKENYEKKKEIYKKNRFRVEQVIGIVKNWFGDRDCVKDFHTVSLYVLARFALYNLILLYKLLLFFVSSWKVGLLLVFLSLGIF